MESAKRASVVIIVWHLNFSFFLKRGEARGVKKAQDMQEENAPTTKNNKKCNSEKSQEFFE